MNNTEHDMDDLRSHTVSITVIQHYMDNGVRRPVYRVSDGVHQSYSEYDIHAARRCARELREMLFVEGFDHVEIIES